MAPQAPGRSWASPAQQVSSCILYLPFGTGFCFGYLTSHVPAYVLQCSTKVVESVHLDVPFTSLRKSIFLSLSGIHVRQNISLSSSLLISKLVEREVVTEGNRGEDQR